MYIFLLELVIACVSGVPPFYPSSFKSSLCETRCEIESHDTPISYVDLKLYIEAWVSHCLLASSPGHQEHSYLDIELLWILVVFAPSSVVPTLQPEARRYRKHHTRKLLDPTN
jgi:hypothetical protein